jgi:hypothetical protein
MRSLYRQTVFETAGCRSVKCNCGEIGHKDEKRMKTMYGKTIDTICAAARFIQRILEVRLPIVGVSGLSIRTANSEFREKH